MPRCRPPAISAVALLLAATLLSDAAAAVYRCGPAGNVYSQQACEDGQRLAVDDTRSPAQQAQARQLLRREQQLADQLARERRAFEAANPARPPAGIRSAPVAAAPADKASVRPARGTGRASSAAPKRAAGGGGAQPDFVAVVPGSASKKPQPQR